MTSDELKQASSLLSKLNLLYAAYLQVDSRSDRSYYGMYPSDVSSLVDGDVMKLALDVQVLRVKTELTALGISGYEEKDE